MSDQPTGSTTIAPEVLHTIARLTTLNAPGVSRMAPLINPYDRVLTQKYGEGVKIVLDDDTLFVDLFVVLDSEDNVRVVSKNIQENVSRAITEMVGMQVASVNIHIVDIDFDI
jgi:uncharacterized alkaline shock family protein YloU